MRLSGRTYLVFISIHFNGHLCNLIECGRINLGRLLACSASRGSQTESTTSPSSSSTTNYQSQSQSQLSPSPQSQSSVPGRPNKFCVWLNKHVVELSPAARLAVYELRRRRRGPRLLYSHFPFFFWRVEHLVNKRFLIVLIFFTLPPAASASAPAPAPNVTFAAAVHIELEPTGEEIKAEAEAEAEAQKSANSAAQNFNYHE